MADMDTETLALGVLVGGKWIAIYDEFRFLDSITLNWHVWLLGITGAGEFNFTVKLSIAVPF